MLVGIKENKDKRKISNKTLTITMLVGIKENKDKRKIRSRTPKALTAQRTCILVILCMLYYI